MTVAGPNRSKGHCFLAGACGRDRAWPLSIGSEWVSTLEEENPAVSLGVISNCTNNLAARVRNTNAS
jgi:hypothetical protein